MDFISAIISYLIGLAVNERSGSIIKDREAALQAQLNKREALSKAISSTRSLDDEVRSACIHLAQRRDPPVSD